MSDGFLVSNESAPLIQMAIDSARSHNPFGPKDSRSRSTELTGNLRGYLMQSVSRGEQAACQIVSYDPSYRCYKLDLAGVIYLNHPDGESKFQLVFSGTGVDFETPVLTIEDLSIGKLLYAIVEASDDLLTIDDMVGGLGHPVISSSLVNNSDLYPQLPESYKPLDMINSLIGSWIFGFKTSRITTDFDVNLKFTISENNPVQLNGPAVMTLEKINECPTDRIEIATDVMDVTQPTPLRGGTKVVLIPFEDIGYGIVAANPREYLFRLDFGN